MGQGCQYKSYQNVNGLGLFSLPMFVQVAIKPPNLYFVLEEQLAGGCKPSGCRLITVKLKIVLSYLLYLSQMKYCSMCTVTFIS